ncbi:hypothetical protein PQX77_013697 [Marasmius sp. AFHP31]|nr:hypothetical protein PQX77_013697 [Marasmius sp. AFHP31]
MALDEESVKQAMEPYTSIQMVVVKPIATLSVLCLIYGTYIMIFGLSINNLWRRRESPASNAYMKWIIALFVLTTIFNVTLVWIHVDQTLEAFNAIKANNYVPLHKSLSGQSSLVPTTQLWVFLA